MKKGFDNEKYLKEQTGAILEVVNWQPVYPSCIMSTKTVSMPVMRNLRLSPYGIYY